MRAQSAIRTIAAVVFAILLVSFITRSTWPVRIPPENLAIDRPMSALSDFLFISFGPGFLLVGLLLVAATLAAVFIAKEEISS
ncbi:MAG: hypothetical protein ACE5KO_05445 [Candidatus Bathyarchaeia archaeon]